ncbi:aldose 1-epimerase family protein [Paenarthrobacter sp. Z7-10]|uniref:aldose 1-epimerase family protein n=1 Tax=Paenarthrobacter sp. Z7-10 TaxID=2787635 RepID=UPI0022A8E43F|nr:aldose 1-epimerase family protein [Paenarthrobacter sp. Z7-10]MCZ2402180.1 aldose 1-epimerase family protein [Paenarthrobacter sp. Z7-10]
MHDGVSMDNSGVPAGSASGTNSGTGSTIGGGQARSGTATTGTGTPAAAPPSGAQYEISHGEQTVMLTEVGAALRSYTVGERTLLDGYEESEMCTGARGQSLIPWPNRIADGCYSWGGSDHQLDLTEPAKHGAIHGLTRWANWQLAESSQASASFTHVLHACQGWPWVLRCRLDYALDDGGLTVRTSVTNLSDSPCPYGTGAHPYLSVGSSVINTDRAQVPGSIYLPVDERGIPVGRKAVDGTRYDLRTAQQLADRQIDVAYTDLHRGPDGRARVRLESGANASAVELWVDESYPYLEIFTGDTLPQPERRRTGMGVEPMTCAPNAFNSGDGLLTLLPGQHHSASWGIDPFPEQ